MKTDKYIDATAGKSAYMGLLVEMGDKYFKVKDRTGTIWIVEQTELHKKMLAAYLAHDLKKIAQLVDYMRFRQTSEKNATKPCNRQKVKEVEKC